MQWCCHISIQLSIWHAGLHAAIHDAEDIVQEAYLRAFKFFDGFHGEDSARGC